MYKIKNRVIFFITNIKILILANNNKSKIKLGYIYYITKIKNFIYLLKMLEKILKKNIKKIKYNLLFLIIFKVLNLKKNKKLKIKI